MVGLEERLERVHRLIAKLEEKRQAINEWIRTSGKFDAVIDLDEAVRDPEDPTRLKTEYDSGDHLHLNPTGFEKMAETIDLSLFKMTD